LFVALAALTSINATMIVGARANYALGKDWPSLAFMGQWKPSKGSPSAAYITQAVISLALVGFGALQSDGFESMVEFTAPVFWIFLMLVGLSVFIMRHRDPSTPRPFRVPLYPITPILFCISCGYLAYSSISYAQSKGAIHISFGVMALGLIALLFLNSPARSRKS
jgi:amino acid transporter